MVQNKFTEKLLFSIQSFNKDEIKKLKSEIKDFIKNEIVQIKIQKLKIYFRYKINKIIGYNCNFNGYNYKHKKIYKI